MSGRAVVGWLRYWGQALLLPVYWLSFLFPRNKRIWLFGSTFGRRFTDSPRYFYLYCNAHHKETVRAVWISRNRAVLEFLWENGYEAYHPFSFKGAWCCLRGKAYLFDNYSKDISFWLSGGAVKVNLWHGVALKKINHDNLHDRFRHPKNGWERFRYALRTLSDEKPSHYVLATSGRMAEIYERAFQTSREHVIVEGYPRNDALFGNKGCFGLLAKEESAVVDGLLRCKREGRRVILYLPTFRDSETMFFEVMDLAAFQGFLERNGFVFYTKLHPKSKLNAMFCEKCDRGDENGGVTMVYVEPEVDVYAILKYADVLVTDYSSVYADYLLLNRPSVLFPYDYEAYTNETREMYFAYDEFMRDEKAFTMEELMEKLLSVTKRDGRERERLEARAWMFERADGNACEGLYGKVKEIIGWDE